MATAKEILVATKELLAKPEAWTQRVFAKDRNGWSVHAEAEAAVCWCLSGALDKVAMQSVQEEGSYTFFQAKGYIYAAMHARGMPSPDIPSFNDEPATKHEHIVAVLNDAIVRCTRG